MSAVPLEFRLAASRTWLAMTRLGYRLNSSSDHAGFERPLLAPVGSGMFDLRGFRRLPSNSTVQWDLFVDHPGSADRPQAARRFGLRIATAGHIWSNPWEPALSHALSTILSGCDSGLPSGTAVARALGCDPVPVAPGSPEDTLWVYMLLEAEQDGGVSLGPVGSEIFASVIGRLLYNDTFGYVRCDPAWTPRSEPVLRRLTSPTESDWGLAELIAASGAPMSASAVDSLLAGSVSARRAGMLQL